MLKYGNDHVKVLAHLQSCSLLITSPEPSPVLSKATSIDAASIDEKLNNPGITTANITPKEVKVKSITRSSLGIKRLSHKKIERLKTEFIELIDTVRPEINNNKKLTNLVFNGQHSNLFTNISGALVTVNNENVKITIDEEKFQLILSLLNDENTAIIIPKSKVSELHEMRALLINE